MIGIIVTGHGTFATGLADAVKLLAGVPEHFAAVNYAQEDTTDDLADKLHRALDSMADCTDGIAFFADTVDGAPYREALELQRELAAECDISVIGGCSVGMVMEMNIARSYIRDLTAFTDMAVEEGKRRIVGHASSEDGKDLD